MLKLSRRMISSGLTRDLSSRRARWLSLTGMWLMFLQAVRYTNLFPTKSDRPVAWMKFLRTISAE